MRQRITIEAPVETQGPDGSILQAWQLYATTWASVEPLIGNEYFAPQREQTKLADLGTKYEKCTVVDRMKNCTLRLVQWSMCDEQGNALFETPTSKL